MESNWKNLFGQKTHETDYQLARRRTFLKVDLDALTENVNILRTLCSAHTEVIGVVKGNAYGHGSVQVCRHLTRRGVRHFAVATPWEGAELRKAGVEGFIQVFGNATEEEIPDLLEFDLTPTVSNIDFLSAWVTQIRQNREHCPGNILSPFEEEEYGSVVIKVDTGMSRNGCQPEELDTVVDYCDEHNINIHSIMTHFACAWDDPEFTHEQLADFLACTKRHKERGIKLHAANTAGTLLGYGTDLDFIRPGIAMYGLTPDTTEYAIEMYRTLGLKPVLKWMAKPNLVKTMAAGKKVGYDRTYKCEEGDVVATLPVGYADGFNRLLSGSAILTTIHGTPAPVIGRVSMDAISVKLPSDDPDCREICVISDDFASPNSVVQLSKQLHTITYEVTTSLAARLARLYTAGGETYITDVS